MIKKIWHKIAGLIVANYRLESLSNAENKENKEFLLSEIILHYHVLEKGLSMPERRYIFGTQNLIELCGLVIEYFNKFGNSSSQITYAVQAIKEYDIIHKKHQKELPHNLRAAIDSVISNFPTIEESSQPRMNDVEFFNASDKPFYKFSHGRHTCRHFNGSVSEKIVINAIALAQETSPSACNRQSVKIKLINDKQLIKSILSLQSGNRGFGHAFDKLIIITTDMSYWNYITNIGGYVDGGIFLMNLLYSLYYYKIGACTLNSYFEKKKDKLVRAFLNLPRNEEFVAIIGIGKISENVVLARSPRKTVNEILKIY